MAAKKKSTAKKRTSWSGGQSARSRRAQADRMMGQAIRHMTGQRVIQQRRGR